MNQMEGAKLKKTIGLQRIGENRLCAFWRDQGTRRIFKQGKRVGKECPIPLNVRKEYVKVSLISAINLMSRSLGITYLEAFSQMLPWIRRY